MVNARNGLNVLGGVNVSGSTTLNNTLGVLGALSVSGITSLYNPLTVNSNASITGTLGVTGAITTSGQLTTTKNIFLNSNAGNDSLWVGTNIADSSGTNLRLFCAGATPYVQFYGGPLNIRYGSNVIGTLSSSGDLVLTGKLNLPGDITCSGNIYASSLQGNNSGSFNVLGTGSDVNFVTVSIPNYANVQVTTIHFSFSTTTGTAAAQLYLLINTGDLMTTNLSYLLSSNGWATQDATTNVTYASLATDWSNNRDVHVRVDIHTKLAFYQVMEVTADYMRQVSIANVPSKTFGNCYSQGNTISQIALRSSTTNGKYITGKYTIPQTGVFS
jgi:hypothetical protein